MEKSVKQMITNYKKSGHGILMVETREETRTLAMIKENADETSSEMYVWSVSSGVKNMRTGKTEQIFAPVDFIRSIQDSSDEKSINVMLDPGPALEDPIFQRFLKDALVDFQSGKMLILLGPCQKIGQNISHFITLVEVPLPSKAELDVVLSEILTPTGLVLENGEREKVLRSSAGLTTDQAANAFSLSLVENKKVDPIIIQREKVFQLKKIGGIEIYQNPPSLDEIGGLDVFKKWMVKAPMAFTNKAKKFGLSNPRGFMAFGVSGTGKTLSARVASSVFQQPLIIASLNAMKSSGYGDAEQMLRLVIQVADSNAPCILCFDEIEKGLGSVSGDKLETHEATSGMMNILLKYLDERTSDVYVIMTANNIEPIMNTYPELVRKGRLDEIFFFDLPNFEERKEIFRIHIKKVRNPENYDLNMLARTSDGFSGAEIMSVVQASMVDAFYEDKDLTDEFLKNAISNLVPQSKGTNMTARLREWAKGRARLASTTDKTNKRLVETK